MAQPSFKPTEAQRKLVEQLSGFGIPQRMICSLVENQSEGGKPVSAETLEKYFRTELDRGKAKALSQVAGRLFKTAISGESSQAVTAAIFILKTQAGWKESKEDVPENEKPTYVKKIFIVQDDAPTA